MARTALFRLLCVALACEARATSIPTPRSNPSAISTPSDRWARAGLDATPKPETHAEAAAVHAKAFRRGRRHVRSAPNSGRTSLPSQAPKPTNPYRVSPAEYGGDPTGKVDSTAAVQAAVAALLVAGNTSAHGMASGITNLGGAMLDLAGGTYLISKPLALPP